MKLAITHSLSLSRRSSGLKNISIGDDKNWDLEIKKRTHCPGSRQPPPLTADRYPIPESTCTFFGNNY